MTAVARNIRVFLKLTKSYNGEIRIPDTSVDRIVGVVCVCETPVGRHNVDIYKATVSGLETEIEFNPERNNNLLYFNVPNNRKDMKIHLINLSDRIALNASIRQTYFICAEGLNLNESIVCHRMFIRQGVLGDKINMGYNLCEWDSTLTTYNSAPKGFCGVIAMSDKEYTLSRNANDEITEIGNLPTGGLNVINAAFYPFSLYCQEMIYCAPKTTLQKNSPIQDNSSYKVHMLLMTVYEEKRKLKYCE